MIRSIDDSKILLSINGKEELLDRLKFQKEHKVDGIIRISKDDFDYFLLEDKITHFNLENSNHKKGAVYLVLKILRNGSLNKSKEVLPLLDLKSKIKFKCVFVKEKIAYKSLKQNSFEFSKQKSVDELKKSIVKNYSISLPEVSKEDLSKLGVSMTILEKIVDSESTRSGFGKGLFKAGKENKQVVALSADLAGSTKVDLFAKQFPERFFQVGVAEQNLVTVASGLAHAGKIPFATSFAAFSPGRNFEQIRTTICYNDVPVKICSTHSGLGVGEDGATHQMLEDLALMRTLPNMIVIQPCDDLEAMKATIEIAKLNKPVYLRLGRQNVKRVTTIDSKFQIGKADILRKGDHVTIIAIGPMVQVALKAAELLEDMGIDAEVINSHTLKPLDNKTILESAKKTDLVLTIEDHQVIGGLGSAVAELLSQNHPVPLKIMGVNDKFGESGTEEELFKKHGLTPKNVAFEIKKLIEDY
jgi:transketolase